VVKAMDPRRPYPVSPSPNVVETARKRAALLTDVVSQLATYQIALKVLADFERRQENLERAADLIDIYHSPDSTKQQFGIEADDAHSHWVNLRQLSESE
jgi:FPC/CPF motif-containing protein YcgG